MGHTYAGPGATIGPGARLRLPRRPGHRAGSVAEVVLEADPGGDRLMPIDPDVAVGADLASASFSWTSSDVLLYHLAIGAGARAGRQPRPGRAALHHRGAGLQVLPSFGVVAPTFHATEPPSLDLPGCDDRPGPGRARLAGDHVHAPAADGRLGHARTTLTDVWDKGKAAVIWQEARGHGPTPARTLWTTRSSIFVRGEGGLGGDRGASEPVEPPDRAPDAETTYADHPAAGAALPALRRPQPAALRPRLRRRRPASRRRSCTGCAPTASCCASSPTACSAATRPGSPASRRGSPAWSSRARRSGSRLARGRPDRRSGHRRRRRPRRRARARRRRAHHRPRQA